MKRIQAVIQEAPSGTFGQEVDQMQGLLGEPTGVMVELCSSPFGTAVAVPSLLARELMVAYPLPAGIHQGTLCRERIPFLPQAKVETVAHGALCLVPLVDFLAGAVPEDPDAEEVVRLFKIAVTAPDAQGALLCVPRIGVAFPVTTSGGLQ